MGKMYGYVRVSSKDQHVQRQMDAVLPLVGDESNIFVDKQSGKDFNRPQYQALKAQLADGDTLIIQSLDRLGRNYHQIKDEWRDLSMRGVGIRVLDFPMLNTVSDGEAKFDLMSVFISNVVLEVLSFVAENERNNIRARQAQGIASAKQRGVKFGREFVCPEGFYPAYTAWKAGRVSAQEAIDQSGMKKSTFYKRAGELNKLLVGLSQGIITPEEAATYDPKMVEHAMEMVAAAANTAG